VPKQFESQAILARETYLRQKARGIQYLGPTFGQDTSRK
jgi:hypothetical protein